MIYTHVLRDMSNAPKSPLDNLMLREPDPLRGYPIISSHPLFSYKSRENNIALRTCFNSSCEIVVMSEPIFPFDTVWIWSKLMAQSLFMPSCLERETSLGISLTVEVMGAIVTSPRYSRIESRVRIRTGLFLSGDLNLYHLISPRFICQPNPALLPIC